jgi:hypothetical protein
VEFPVKPASASFVKTTLLRCLFLFGLASLAFVLGAAVLFFELPGSSFLRRAFVGGTAWYSHKSRPQIVDSEVHLTVGKIDKADRTSDGFTLCMYDCYSRGLLVNMHGETVHQWHVPFSSVWSAPPHLHGRIDDATVYFNDGHIYPNGDLLVLLEGEANLRNPSNGYGLVMLDKDSGIKWKYARNCHHDLDVGENGSIYVLTNEFVEKVPHGLEYLPTPCMVDFVDVISPEGKVLKRISLLEAIHDTPYSTLLSKLERPSIAEGVAPPGFVDDSRMMDILHANSVKVLSRALAPKFPQFRAGQLLVSLRNLDAIAVIDPESGKAVWAARGPWHAQHDPAFVANGHLLLFDNSGSLLGSRVLEYDPATQAFPWVYPDGNRPKFRSPIRGMCERLANGNTLIVNSVRGECFEVTPDQEIVWSCSSGGVTLNRARRYTVDQVPFLRRSPRERP